METLTSFEADNDVTEFLCGKIESLIANNKKEKVSVFNFYKKQIICIFSVFRLLV